MIDEIHLSDHLLANLKDIEGTNEFISEVVQEYLSGDRSPLQSDTIDGKTFKRRLERMLEQAIRKKNPGFDHSIKVNVEWGLREVSGFTCRVSVGIADIDLTSYGPSAVELAPLWQ